MNNTKIKKGMRLYVVTDRSWLGENSLDAQVEECLQAGATFLQLREKDMSDQEFIEEGKKIKKIAQKYEVPFVINDNINVALAIDADGIHVGQSDMNAKDVRAMIGEEKILGVSAANVEEALLAQAQGADYLGIGAVFSTTTKGDARAVSYEMLRQICEAVSIPVVAIGGISENNILELKGSGIDGVAVISAIFAKPDIKKATKNLSVLTDQLIER